MEEKSILITGCSSGIGLCVAEGLLKRGYRVFATARKNEDVEALLNKGMESFQLDLDDSASIRGAVHEVLNKTEGKLFALFNNGGFGQPGAVEDLRRDVLREQFETNVFGYLELTNQILPTMRKQGYGRIIQNSSILGFISLPFRGAYTASKHALEGLSDTLRMELEGTNIFVSIIEPGPIEAKFRKNAYEKYKENINAKPSHFCKRYEAMEERLTKETAPLPFTLPATAVLEKVLRALESSKPKARYYVTTPTYIFACLKRLLPGFLLEKILITAGTRG
ncbi:MAG: SDR family NAD(P)-dependent oxidoreductase [Nitrospina sp.]|jgi:short-subunit dehydrogenase|nr:SDR family NAD(P)-dependent oxidoreductase [Nitrospina sp.]